MEWVLCYSEIETCPLAYLRVETVEERNSRVANQLHPSSRLHHQEESIQISSHKSRVHFGSDCLPPLEAEPHDYLMQSFKSADRALFWFYGAGDS